MGKPINYDLREIKSLSTDILKVWKANREFRLSDAKFENYEKRCAELDEILKKIAVQNRELDESRKIRNKLAIKLRQLNTRARSGLRGYFGPKSSQYGQIKGLPSPKKAVRKAGNPAAAKSEFPPKDHGGHHVEPTPTPTPATTTK